MSAKVVSKEDQLITLDRMRYIKNKASSNLTLLAILFDVFYFVNLYRSDVGTYYYTILIGASIIYNLIFLLAAFLASEGVKTYNEKYCYILIVLGVIQFVRIFIMPVSAHNAYIDIVNSVTREMESVQVMKTGQFLRQVIYLCISGACCLAAAYIGIVRSRKLKAYEATLGEEKRRD